jgi:hypothetical protein
MFFPLSLNKSKYKVTVGTGKQPLFARMKNGTWLYYEQSKNELQKAKTAHGYTLVEVYSSRFYLETLIKLGCEWPSDIGKRICVHLLILCMRHSAREVHPKRRFNPKIY